MGNVATGKSREKKIMKIILEKSKCIGCGSCVAVCPKIFEIAEDGKSHLKESKVNPVTQNEELEVRDVDCATQAAEICPVECIKVK